MDSCLVCDGSVPVHTAVKWVEHFPVCCAKCIEEWDSLTYLEKQRYLECQRALHALMCDQRYFTKGGGPI